MGKQPTPKKPSGGKKPGGKKPPARSKPANQKSPVTRNPTWEPTPLPTWKPTPLPTWKPTPLPVAIVRTRAPTVKPTPWPITVFPPSLQPTANKHTEAPFKEVEIVEAKSGMGMPGKNSIPSTISDASSVTDEDELGCSGDPCPVDDHCRSRYGSCGPGFIYCNIYTIWRKTCPPIVPGTRPTRSPTPRPTRTPQASFVARPFPPTLTVPNKSPTPKPTFLKLAMPSLPTVTGGAPYASFLSVDQGAAASDKAKSSDEDKSESSASEDPNTPESSASEDPNATPGHSQTQGYLNGWTGGGRSGSDAAPCTSRPKRLFAGAMLLFLSHVYL